MDAFGYAKGWTEIGTVFGANGRLAREWHRAGAPILILGEKPVTRIDDLWFWLLDHGDETEKKQGKKGNGRDHD